MLFEKLWVSVTAILKHEPGKWFLQQIPWRAALAWHPPCSHPPPAAFIPALLSAPPHLEMTQGLIPQSLRKGEVSQSSSPFLITWFCPTVRLEDHARPGMLPLLVGSVTGCSFFWWVCLSSLLLLALQRQDRSLNHCDGEACGVLNTMTQALQPCGFHF